ncbi:uncharacterized protein LOC119681839 [Teleopsis dalmanni]|uniref:uncharacterized protein LOC119681839 n=1 Tax=Teleopsis dalmanni TaxID=139649 RepID=UPI0018CEE149|nr:uncharacterized protein LOC119681839 [Teleopsis dalmanni]
MLAKTITEDKPTTNEIQNAQNNEINEIVTASDAAEIATTSSNQETETVAMANDLMNVTPTNLNPITTKTNTTAENVTETVAETTPTHNTTITTKTNATVLTSNDASQSPSVATGKCFVMPTSASSSLKKKKRNKNAHAKQFTNGTLDTEVVGGAAMTTTGADTMPTSIKTSWSMSSLPYDEKQEIRDVIEAKLRVERPYNSLKKTTERRIVETNVCHTLPNSKNHRYSWGSGYSHSSSSLHSNATLGLDATEDVKVVGVKDIHGAKVRVADLVYDIDYDSEIIRPGETEYVDLIIPKEVISSEGTTEPVKPLSLVNEAGDVIYVSSSSAASGIKNKNLDNGCDRGKITSFFNKIIGTKTKIGTIPRTFKIYEY